MVNLAKIADDVLRAVKDSTPKLGDALRENATKNIKHVDEIINNTRKKDAELAGKAKPKPVEKPRLKPVDVRVKGFKRNKKHNEREFDRQLNEQLKTLGNMDLATWWKNRQAYLAGGRPSESVAQQRAARDHWIKKRRTDLIRQGMELDDAAAQAAKEAQSLAATHRLDGIAGGDTTDISGLGDRRVNSSLGAQWRYRVDALDQVVVNLLKKGEDLSQYSFNINFQ